MFASDLNGASTENNEGIHSFTVNTENDLPGDFALLLPENGSIVTDLTPTFVWEEPVDEDDNVASLGNGLSSFNTNIFQNSSTRGPSLGLRLPNVGFGTGRHSNNNRSITLYDIYISVDSLFADVEPIVVETNNYTPIENLDEDIVYYWKVIATDDDGGETESTVHSFTTNSQNSAPLDFTLLTPLS